MKKKKSNAGRKPSTDPKVRVVFFLEQSLVDHNGGMEDCHIKYGDKKQFKEYLNEVHKNKLETIKR